MSSPQTPIGIDLGTTFSVVARVDRHGRPETLPNSEGERWTPSAVLFEEGSVIVGSEARNAAYLEPDGFADFAKRDMGDADYHREIFGETYPPEVIQSLVLKKLKVDYEERYGAMSDVVITVPAYFNEPRRKATQDAGKLAGLNVLDIINEPTAAAIAYGFQQGFLNEDGQAAEMERVLVYDLGGGTFDVTVMEISGNDFKTVATGGDVYLGGIDFDQRLIDYACEQFIQKFEKDPREDAAGVQRLKRIGEDVKRALTYREKTTFPVDQFGYSLRVPITREQFEEMSADLMTRTIFTIRSVVRQAGLQMSDLTRVLLVGGSTRMPMVGATMQKEFRLELDNSVSTDEAVAHGAALYAGVLMAKETGGISGMSVQNVNSHSLGVLGTDTKTGRPRNGIVVPANTPLPVAKGKRFTTARDGQTSVKVAVIEGGNATGQNSTLVGECVVRDLPEGLPKGTQVDVIFTYRENGRLEVRAKIPALNRKAKLVVQRESGLNDDRLEEWKSRVAEIGVSIT